MSARAILPATGPGRATPAQEDAGPLEVILHIGAHRCASTSFQKYLRSNKGSLSHQGVGVWGPKRTRSGLFRGILPGAVVCERQDRFRRARARVREGLEKCAARGLRTLLVSDENMLGGMPTNLEAGALYGDAEKRLALFGAAFDGRIARVALNIRSYEAYWNSAMAYGLTRGRGLPTRAVLDRLATSPRSWRDVIGDVARALPGVPIRVVPFETFAGRPDAQLAALTGCRAPKADPGNWLNSSPDPAGMRDLAGQLDAGWAMAEGTEGHLQPFSPRQAAAMGKAYAEDLDWLAAGGDGLACLVPDPDMNKHRASPAQD